jgi:hypothetical protein
MGNPPDDFMEGGLKIPLEDLTEDGKLKIV